MRLKQVGIVTFKIVLGIEKLVSPRVVILNQLLIVHLSLYNDQTILNIIIFETH